ncbi:hypothetical protein CSOJ01_05482 [Colletotrichum sojae]|uniref:Integral membrane protein n=1 Tax=Colletotrichum sojae TaxID=2175907 RepID=A0A8H6MXI2_9PEZI|nr:hypothetical protein CSOJ01_05482 [Colletotrichum sojae]
MTLSLLALVLATTATAADSSTSSSLIGWVPEPDGRGTFGLLCSCVLTLTICVWTALHLNVPAARSTVRSRAIERTKWVLYGIFAPEIVVATAAAQYIVARWLKREIEKDAAHREDSDQDDKNAGNAHISRHTWDMTQCIYAVMGGFVIDRPAYGHEAGVERVTITPEGIRLLSFVGKLPEIHESQIQDKSKADWMAKSLVCIQAGWMVAQVVGRLIESLPVSLLEINTCGHVVCAVLLYLLWWRPVGESEVELRADGGQEDGKVLVTTHLSIGSPGSRDPSRFLGFDIGDLRPRPMPATIYEHPRRAPRAAYEYHIDQANPTVSPECLRTYFAPPYDSNNLRHSTIYCRRKFPDVQQSKHPHVPINLTLLSQASKAADVLWSQCAGRPVYHTVYFTTVPGIGIFLGETDYVVPHVVNFPSMANLGLGQVNVHRDALRSVLALTAAAYGGLHSAGAGDRFPTRLERTLWLTASLVIACSGGMLWFFFLARQVWPRFDVFVSGAAPGARLAGLGQRGWAKTAKAWLFGFVMVVFAAARVFLVVEAFVSLREAPAALYETPEWSDFFPHFQ